MTTSTLTDTQVAQNLINAVGRIHDSGNTDDDATEDMIGAESEIAYRLNLPLDWTEMGLTTQALTAVEAFVEKNTGRRWTYAV